MNSLLLVIIRAMSIGEVVHVEDERTVFFDIEKMFLDYVGVEGFSV